MRITFDVNLNVSSESQKEILALLKSINLKLNNVPTKAEFQAVAQEFRDAFLNISNDITRLTDQLGNPGLTDAEEAEVLAEFRTLAADAKALADRTPEAPAEPQP
jgi:hypothetical protein